MSRRSCHETSERVVVPRPQAAVAPTAAAISRNDRRVIGAMTSPRDIRRGSTRIAQRPRQHESNWQADAEDEYDGCDDGRTDADRRLTNVAQRQHDEVHCEPDDHAV